MPDILCMGEPMLEFNQQPPDAEGRVMFLQGHGGDTSNAAVAAARQGARTGYFTALGADAAGQALRDLWAAEGVDSSRVRTDTEAPTGIYFVTHSARGHDFTFYRSGSAAARLRPADVPDDLCQGVRWLHVSGISQAISPNAADAVFRAIALAREAGTQVSYDTNLRLRLWPVVRAAAVMHAAVAMSDLALPSLEDAIALTGLMEPEAILDFYLRLAPMVVLKLGEAGALVGTREARWRIPPVQVAAVDATGAGDCFAGALLARLCDGDALAEAARYANQAAALSTRGYGAVAPIPVRAEVLHALRS
jgi:2-dehydro-3-deoxygluconokinase